MKFLQIMGSVNNSSFTSFEFSYHEADDVIVGDQIWSNGHEIEIADYIDSEHLKYLISITKNGRAFKGALRRMEFDVD